MVTTWQVSDHVSALAPDTFLRRALLKGASAVTATLSVMGIKPAPFKLVEDLSALSWYFYDSLFLQPWQVTIIMVQENCKMYPCVCVCVCVCKCVC